jgi:predicted NAD/FAD-binding protein
VREDSVLQRKDLSLKIFSPRARPIQLKTGKAPAPLNLLLGLIAARGLSLRDRARAIRFCRALAKTNFTLSQDETCLSLFRRYQQSDKLISSLWEPLCLATLNTHINEASALVFLRTLRETFAYSRSNSNLLFTATDLGRLFPDPALDYIERNGGSIRLLLSGLAVPMTTPPSRQPVDG